MPFHAHNTPEALLGRNDSLNPSKTCAGITASGRACRRTIAAGGESRYCWQHATQAAAPSPSLVPEKRPGRSGRPPQHRTSIESLTGRLGILSTGTQASSHAPPRPRPPPPKHKPGLLASLLCCVGAAGRQDDYYEIVRHKQRVKPRPTSAPVPNGLSTGPLSLIPKGLPPQTVAQLAGELAKPISPADELGYIYIFWLTPADAPAPSERDTATLLSGVDVGAAWSLDVGPDPSERQASDILSRYGTVRRTEGTRSLDGREERRVLLKIGRANNVHRRMNEWSRQCGYDVSLLRFYPYVPTSSLSPAASPGQRPPSGTRHHSGEIRKVPHVHRVERLIHLELEGKRHKMGACETCGRLHREWFEVPATTRGIKKVDDVVKRWVAWAEGVA